MESMNLKRMDWALEALERRGLKFEETEEGYEGLRGVLKIAVKVDGNFYIEEPETINLTTRELFKMKEEERQIKATIFNNWRAHSYFDFVR